MIPDRLIEKAALAMYASWRQRAGLTPMDGWGGMSPESFRQEVRAVLEAVADDLRAEAWDEGHRTPWVREPDECECCAWSSSECACGLYGTGRITTPNPYRQETD